MSAPLKMMILTHLRNRVKETKSQTNLTVHETEYQKTAQTEGNPQVAQGVPRQTEYSEKIDVFEGEAIQDKPL